MHLDGGQRRIQESRRVDIVKAEHRHIVRHTDSGLLKSLHGADRHRITGHHHRRRRRPLIDQLLHQTITAHRAEVSEQYKLRIKEPFVPHDLLIGPDTGLLFRHQASVPGVDALDQPLAADIGDHCMPRFEQRVHHPAGSALEIGNHDIEALFRRLVIGEDDMIIAEQTSQLPAVHVTEHDKAVQTLHRGGGKPASACIEDRLDLDRILVAHTLYTPANGHKIRIDRFIIRQHETHPNYLLVRSGLRLLPLTVDIIQLAGDIQHPLPGLARDGQRRVVIQDSRYRRGRHVRQLGNILDSGHLGIAPFLLYILLNN
ncbi:hypothetical protein D3C71_1432490 [compost metagenome]